MEKEIYFFYDESSHSRKLTSNTINDNEFKYDFVSVIVGIPKNSYSIFEKDYFDFEEKWKKYYSVDELKSTIIKGKKYKNGLSSFKKDDIEFYTDFFNMLLSHEVYLHFGIFNKIEYLVNQMLCESSPLQNINFESVSYAISKALCVYHPKEVLDAIENNINDFLPKFRNFLEKRRKLNTRINGESEENAFSQMLYILDSINKNLVLEWNYIFSFDGFKKFIEELKLKSILLSIDKEGTGNTKQSAIDDGIINVKEVDSKKCCGVRCADLFAGFISNFINSIELATSYGEDEVARNESLLGMEWFKSITEETFKLYKLSYKVFYELHNSWYKFYCSTYSDGVLLFLALLKHLDEYQNFENFKKDSEDYHQHRVNTIAYYDLKSYHEKIDKKFKIETIEPNDKEYYLNQKGAKCYFNYKKHNVLTLPTNGKKLKYFVLSVGFFAEKKHPFAQPCITISENGQPICYLLPADFSNWVMKYYSLAIIHQNIFPCFLTIFNENNEFSLELSEE